MMDCYKDAIEKMQIHDMFSVPILRQLEGMRSSIVYQKNRPGPLARKYDHYMHRFKENKREKSQKRLKEKAKNDSSKEPSQNDASASPQAEEVSPPDAKAQPRPKSKMRAKAKAEAKAKARENSPIPDQPSDTAKEVVDTEKGKSEASTAPTSSFEKELDASTSQAQTSAMVGQGDGASITKCPVSGQEAMSHATCPFVAFLGATGTPPEKLALLQSLKDGSVLLASPEAEPSSPSFGVVSM